MASSLVKSIRVSPELWSFVEQRAELKDVSANAWLVRCIEDARTRLTAPKAPAK